MRKVPTSLTKTFNFNFQILIHQEHKVRITPYSESASESSNVKNYTSLPTPVSPRRIAGHAPIAIVPKEMPEMTTEAETVCLRIKLSFINC